MHSQSHDDVTQREIGPEGRTSWEDQKQKKPRKWSFGMGGGSLSASFSDQPMFAAYDVAAWMAVIRCRTAWSIPKRITTTLFLSCPIITILDRGREESPQTDFGRVFHCPVGSVTDFICKRVWIIRILRPIGITMDRWNEDRPEASFSFGIPLSVTYRIAELESSDALCVSAGVILSTTLWDISISYKVDNDNTFKNTTSSRMKPLLWSAGSGVESVIRSLNLWAPMLKSGHLLFRQWQWDRNDTFWKTIQRGSSDWLSFGLLKWNNIYINIKRFEKMKTMNRRYGGGSCCFHGYDDFVSQWYERQF